MSQAEKMRLIDEKEIPVRVKKKSQEWLRMFLKIPEGKAWVITEQEAGVKATSLKTVVNRLKAIGELPDSYRAIQRRRKDGTVTIYILHSATSSAKGTESKKNE